MASQVVLTTFNIEITRLTHSLQIIEKDKIIPNLLCESSITLIPKLDEDNIKEKNYRKIT